MTICRKFYGNDGLHFNSTGLQLLGALISRFLFKAFKEEPAIIQKTPSTQEFGGPTSSTFKLESAHGICSPPRIVFADASLPPPSVADPHHFPPLPASDFVLGNVESNSAPVLTGFSDAVTKQVKRLPQTKVKKRTCYRKCM